jgi:hypothetical protein
LLFDNLTMRLDRLIIIINLAVFGVLPIFKSYENTICDNEINYNLTTFQCHCPKKWLEILANGIITRNSNKIQPCESFDRWIKYPIEIIIYE